MTDPYDELPYKSRAFAFTHPAALATQARLFGVDAARPGACRVLELGCSAGGNLIPMAHGLPDATFVGVDRNAGAIHAAHDRSRDLDLGNITWHTADLLDLPDLGTFDYIVAHGVYSWVPPDVQRALLAACRERLNPNGVAYISYNTLPGWAHRQALRTMARFHAGQRDTLAETLGQVRALVNLVRQATPEDTPLRGLMEAEHQHFSAMPDWYVTHEHLAEHNEALWFHEFVARAGEHQLQFLGEAELRDMVALDLTEGVRQQVEALGTDQLRLEQYLDFVRHRTFRRTLLVHDDVAIDRDIGLDRIADMHVAGALAASPTQPGSADPETPAPSDPVDAALWQTIRDHLPASLPVQQLVASVRQKTGADVPYDDVANRVFSGVLQGGLHLSVMAHHAATPSAHPLGATIARDEVERGESWVTNLRHQGVQLDPYMVCLLALLDGQTTHEQLVQSLADAAMDGRFDLLDLQETPVTTRAYAVEVLGEGLPRALDVLAYYALLQ